MKSLKKISKDTSSGSDVMYMTDSEYKVVCFDDVIGSYLKNRKVSITPCSCDALCVRADGSFVFIEFKMV